VRSKMLENPRLSLHPAVIAEFIAVNSAGRWCYPKKQGAALTDGAPDGRRIGSAFVHFRLSFWICRCINGWWNAQGLWVAPFAHIFGDTLG
jgi:hypothetical protein